MKVQQLLGVSTRVVMWIAGYQEIRLDVTGVGTDSARVTLTWEVAQVNFTAADQVALLAKSLRDMTGVTAVLPPRVHPSRIHGSPAEVGPLPVALVTFSEPREVQVIPGRTVREGEVVARWMDLTTGYLSLRVVDKAGWTSLATALNQAETVAAAALPALSVGHREPTH